MKDIKELVEDYARACWASDRTASQAEDAECEREMDDAMQAILSQVKIMRDALEEYAHLPGLMAKPAQQALAVVPQVNP